MFRLGSRLQFVKYDLEDHKAIEKYTLDYENVLEGTTKQKTKNNMVFVNVCVDAFIAFGINTMILYIDGMKRRTSEMAIAAGIPPSQLIPVNDDPEIASHLRKLAPNTICAKFCDALDLLSPEMLISIRVVWYDGCATLIGNKQSCPMDDINKTLSNIKNDIILAITFSSRSNHKLDKRTAKILDSTPEELQDDSSDTEVEHVEKKYNVRTQPRKLYVQMKDKGVSINKQIRGLEKAICKHRRKIYDMGSIKTVYYGKGHAPNMVFKLNWLPNR